ncbi:hypothetical protein JCM17478_17670 [Thermopirellula anaerolimosa]
MRFRQSLRRTWAAVKEEWDAIREDLHLMIFGADPPEFQHRVLYVIKDQDADKEIAHYSLVIDAETGEDLVNVTGWAAAKIPPEERITEREYYRRYFDWELPPDDGTLPPSAPDAIYLGLDDLQNDSSEDASLQNPDSASEGPRPRRGLLWRLFSRRP